MSMALRAGVMRNKFVNVVVNILRINSEAGWRVEQLRIKERKTNEHHHPCGQSHCGG